jgi:hypothetical protein
MANQDGKSSVEATKSCSSSSRDGLLPAGIQDVGNHEAPACRVLSARACSPSRAPVDSFRRLHKAIIGECARGAGGTRAIVMGTLGGFPNPPAMVRAERSSAAPHARATGPLPHCHPPRLRRLDSDGPVKDSAPSPASAPSAACRPDCLSNLRLAAADRLPCALHSGP